MPTVLLENKIEENEFYFEGGFRKMLLSCLDQTRTQGGHIGSYRVNLARAEADFVGVATYFGCSADLKFRHYVIRFSSQEAAALGYPRYWHLKRIAETLASYFANHNQVIFAVHELDNPEIHLLVSNVSYQTGRRFPVESKDYEYELMVLEDYVAALMAQYTRDPRFPTSYLYFDQR